MLVSLSGSYRSMGNGVVWDMFMYVVSLLMMVKYFKPFDAFFSTSALTHDYLCTILIVYTVVYA